MILLHFAIESIDCIATCYSVRLVFREEVRVLLLSKITSDIRGNKP